MAKSKKNRRRPDTPRNPIARPPSPPARPFHGGNTKATTSSSSGDLRHEDPVRWWREATESIVVAIVLALLFRAFEAEAFVIPTGSMAPTLQGQHKDLHCQSCNKLFRSGASREVATSHAPAAKLTSVICPMCHAETEIDRNKPNHDSFSGDRILVNKWIYQFSDPQRWDVIVFKFPGNAKQNYIKRLVGLPGEQLRIYHGDIHVRREDETEFTVANKSPGKQLRTMQLVHDSRYVPQQLIDIQWPSRWHSNDPQRWQPSEDQSAYRFEEPTEEVNWLRYRHLVPTTDEWQALERGRDIPSRRGELITDFYEYNESIMAARGYPRGQVMGLHWVGDLALEGRFQIEGDSSSGEGNGELLLDLVEAGRHHTCRIDTSDGTVTLTIDGGGTEFAGGVSQLTGTTTVVGEGRYKLRFSNVDNQLRLWVGRKLVQFKRPDGVDHDGKYTLTDDPQRPMWSPTDPGDLEPLGIGVRNLRATATDLRVWRDVYYIATRGDEGPGSTANDYGYRETLNFLGPRVREVFMRPEEWSQSPLFSNRRAVEFPDEGVFGPDQFFPMGDNSPQSKDARLWHTDVDKDAGYDHPVPVPAYVEREQLIGKAFFVYWPHTWKAGTRALPVIPNIRRMGTIR